MKKLIVKVLCLLIGTGMCFCGIAGFLVYAWIGTALPINLYVWIGFAVMAVIGFVLVGIGDKHEWGRVTILGKTIRLDAWDYDTD